jgi:hypothetical protein
MNPPPLIPERIEEYRDRHWRREETRPIETAYEAERFIEEVGFAACLTDARRPGPSLYVAVCGRRDAVMPGNVQKDAEASQAWVLKDEVLGRGKVYYAKLARGKATFLAPRLVPHFNAVWGVRRAEEARRLSRDARAILRVLRSEWEMATSDLREESRVGDRRAFTHALDELQAAMLVEGDASLRQVRDGRGDGAGPRVRRQAGRDALRDRDQGARRTSLTRSRRDHRRRPAHFSKTRLSTITIPL